LIGGSDEVFAALSKPFSLNTSELEWPFSKPPDYSWVQGEAFAARLAAYCKFSRVIPTFWLEGGILKVDERESQLCREWVQEISLNEATLKARHDLIHDKEPRWQWELRWVSKLFGLHLGSQT
jgi:hypothetical protein